MRNDQFFDEYYHRRSTDKLKKECFVFTVKKETVYSILIASIVTLSLLIYNS